MQSIKISENKSHFVSGL